MPDLKRSFEQLALEFQIIDCSLTLIFSYITGTGGADVFFELSRCSGLAKNRASDAML